MKQLFQVVIDQCDGEREYSHNLFVVCNTQAEAEAWAAQELLEWFDNGDDDYHPQVDDTGNVWDSTGEVCANIAYVTTADFFYATDLNGLSVPIFYQYEVNND